MPLNIPKLRLDFTTADNLDDTAHMMVDSVKKEKVGVNLRGLLVTDYLKKITTTTVYKFTTKDMTTHGGRFDSEKFKWQVGQWYMINEERNYYDLCSNSWFHAYETVPLALLHGAFHLYPHNDVGTAMYLDSRCELGRRLWKCDAAIQVMRDGYSKLGVKAIKLVDELKEPVEVKSIHYVRYALAVVLDVVTKMDWTSIEILTDWARWCTCFLETNQLSSDAMPGRSAFSAQDGVDLCLKNLMRKCMAMVIMEAVPSSKESMGLFAEYGLSLSDHLNMVDECEDVITDAHRLGHVDLAAAAEAALGLKSWYHALGLPVV